LDKAFRLFVIGTLFLGHIAYNGVCVVGCFVQNGIHIVGHYILKNTCGTFSIKCVFIFINCIYLQCWL